MRVLVACKYSGQVRDAFIAAGHDAVSCDLLPTERAGPHHQGDVLQLLSAAWDLMVAFPPCTDLAASGARWWPAKRADGRQQRAVAFVRALADSPIPRVAIENPVGYLSTAWRQPDQIVQPWMFGHGETKTTCLWLKALPPLNPTDVVPGRATRVHRMPDSLGRAKRRSLTYPGIARAMAQQWGALTPDVQRSARPAASPAQRTG